MAVAFGEEDTLFGTEDGPCHAVAKSSGSELAEVGGIKGGLLLGEGDCGICRHGGVDGRAFGPQGQMIGSGHVLKDCSKLASDSVVSSDRIESEAKGEIRRFHSYTSARTLVGV